jgi:microcystin-dependent protein
VDLGEADGEQMVSLSTNQMPVHIHPNAPSISGFNATAQPGISQSPGGLVPAVTTDSLGANVMAYGAPDGITQMVGSFGTTNPAGGSQPINIQVPSLALQYIICTNGIYPQRP